MKKNKMLHAGHNNGRENVVVEGGSAFVNKLVENICRWAQFSQEPMFVIQTEWNTVDVTDVYHSMVIQWTHDKWQG